MNETLYQSIVRDRSRAPLYAGRPATYDAYGHGENRMCGDEVTVFFSRDGSSWRHEAKGCAILTASADLMCAAIDGRDITTVPPLREQFEQLVKTGRTDPDLGDLNALASIAQYPARLRCATLPWSGLTSALDDISATPRSANADHV